MPTEIYDYDADNSFLPEEKPPKKDKNTTAKNKNLIILVVVIIIAIIALSVSSAFSSNPNDEIEPPSDSSASDSEPTADATTESGNDSSGGTTENSSGTETETQTTDAPNPAVVIDPSNYTISDKDDPTYFDDVVFIGDSVSYGMELYVTGERANGNNCLGNAQFLTSGSLSYANLLWDVSDESVHPTYNGKKMKLEESLPLINPGKIYILLGSNDIGLYGVDGSVENAKTMLGNIHDACPDATIIVLATTPKLKAAEKRSSSLNNKDIDAFNAKMSESCAEWNYIWLDFASQFKMDDGTLNPDYCGDPEGMGIHFLGSAYKMWVDYFEANKIYPAS